MLPNFYPKSFPKCNTNQSFKLLEYKMTWKTIYDLMLKFLQLGFRKVNTIWSNFNLNSVYVCILKD